MTFNALEIVGLILGSVMACWGLFHQLIVGGAITMFRNISESEARLFIMSWVAQGAFMSFMGILPVAMILLHGIYNPGIHTVFMTCGIAALILSGHVFLTGFTTHLKPIQVGALIEAAYGLYLVIVVLFT